MPSGDAWAAAYFTGAYWLIFNFPYLMFLCIPLSSLGRVYVHCHWLGDVIVGAIFGLITIHYVFSEYYFRILAMPFFYIFFDAPSDETI